MLTQEIKRHIDAARQVLVGVVPNPLSQIDQITNALIYKFMDDMDQSAIKAGGAPCFFIDELERYAWTRLMDSRLGNQERMNLYSEALIKFSESKQLPDLFRTIFKSAFLPYRSPEVLGLFLKEMDYFDYSHSEELGNAYEYLLSIMGSQGDAGQFRTPHHIIDFIVEAVNPTKGDKVLDPACGTAGFLVSAYKHILQQHDGVDEDGNKNDEKPLTPDERRALMSNFEGYDVDPGMVRISQVNLYLHNFRNPKIFNFNTLSDEERWKDKFDVILANPPFMSPKGGVSTHKKFSITSSRSEVLFVDYIMHHLRPNGRAGIIVPEGIIFQSGTAHKQLRKNLVEDGLYAVVSLPSGVFQPYSGVKTSILLFDNNRSKKNTELLFIKIENDGYDLGAAKRLINKNDLPLALEILSKWNTGEKVESKLALFVDKKTIAENDDYNLSIDRYRKTTDYTNAKWPMATLGDLFEMQNGRAFKKTEWANKGLPIIRIANLNDFNSSYNYFVGEYDSRIEINAGDLLFSWSGTRGTSFGPHYWVREKGLLNQHIYRFDPKIKNILKKYAFYAISKILPDIEDQAHGAGGLVHVTKTRLQEFKIPLPPIEVQEQIVAELDGYQKIISGARQVVENWKPKIDVDPEWEKVKLEDVCETTSGGTPLKSKAEYYENAAIPWLRSGEVSQGFVRKSELFITEKGLKDSSAKLFPINTVLVAMYGATAGQVGILKFESATNQAICGILPNKDFIPEFLFQSLKDQKEIMISFAGGGAQPNISQGVIRNLVIPRPSLEIQQQIVEKIEAERGLVEANKKLIDIYEQKMKDMIAKVWEK